MDILINWVKFIGGLFTVYATYVLGGMIAAFLMALIVIHLSTQVRQ